MGFQTVRSSLQGAPSRGNGQGSWRAAGYEAGLRSGLISEEAFTEMLRFERRRSERSRKPFLLMRLGIEDLLQNLNGESPRVLQALFSAIASCTRETDIAGWYEAGGAVGVLFTELGSGEPSATVERICSKVLKALEDKLSPETLSLICISSHVYPEDARPGKPGGHVDRRLYPDLSPKRSRRLSLTMKRVMDVAGSILALILFSPVFLAIAIAIKLNSKGPVFFRQERVGQKGELFTCLKFRTMAADNDHRIHKDYVSRLIRGEGKKEKETGHFKMTNDPRVTPVGRFLRKTSLDEAPQFINVLKGEMSLVGPRPPIPYELEAYDLWHRRRVLEAKPGITGLWQVRGRSRTTFDEMVRLDLQYARSWSLWLDMKILLETPRAVFSGKGAY